MPLFERHHNVQPCSLQTFDGLRIKRVNCRVWMVIPLSVYVRFPNCLHWEIECQTLIPAM